MPRQLKVYRMPIGFHDAYVAAPSQKAAAEAWGSDVAVFARGEAELVEDPALTAAPLAEPGKVIKRLRGTAEEQVAALGPSLKRSTAKASKPKAAVKPKPRPSRAALEEAEQALSEAQAEHEKALSDLARREAALARERSALEKKQGEELAHLQAQHEKARAAYQAAMERWRES
jgi:hypothetical protein